MMVEDVTARLDTCTAEERALLVVLAIAGEPMGRQRILEHMRALGVALPLAQWADELARLRERGLVVDMSERGVAIAPDLAWPVLDAALDDGLFDNVAGAYAQVSTVRRDWQGTLMLRTYRQGLALLRIALLTGQEHDVVFPLLDACQRCHESSYLHPLVDVCARPFAPALMERIHPRLREGILHILVMHARSEPALAPGVREYAERLIPRSSPESPLRRSLGEHYILCGRLDDALALVNEMSDSPGLFLRSVVQVLRDDSDAGLAGIDASIKQLRRETGKRKAVFDGHCAHIAMAALLRSSDPGHLKLADAWLEIETRAVQRADNAVWFQLGMLHEIQRGTVDAALFGTRSWEMSLEPTVFRALIHHWLALPTLNAQGARLEDMLLQSEAAGFDLWSAQLAGVLAQMGQAGHLAHEQRASELRRKHRLPDMTGWFAREEPWERQLNALINLQPAANVENVRESRLVWLIRYDPHLGVQELEPREQKRDAQGGWSRGRAMGLKRLAEEGAQLDFLTAQDLQAVNAIAGRRYYAGSGIRFELEVHKALAALVGHPLLFWMDAPGTRVELLPGEPELLVKKLGDKVSIVLNPPVEDNVGDVVVTRETPTRLRLVHIRDEHRRIAAIVGEGLTVPMEAERRVLRAIGAVSSIVTVQSDIGASSSDIETVPADPRLHVLLRPYQHGMRMQLLVRPVPGGAYYGPGEGAANVIADVEGIRTEARRNLNAEREAERQLVGTCQALEHAEPDHGEWLLGQPLLALELVDQLRALDGEAIVVAWPEGEKFRVTKKATTKSVRVQIRRERDWFAASGDVVIDEGRVMNLRTLLEKIQESGSRFVALGENEYLALSDELHRRLTELGAYGELHGDGIRTHALASFALDELAREAGHVDADKAWQGHLERMADNAAYLPELPSTLQAELRDYQVDGFQWLARLAHWGVGACLADDMGLGKTLQALALLLTRAKDGPALVVAPTSVCLNWIDEAARFAPTLKLHLFGPGERAATIDNAGPFDVVVVSYGLLQLEAARFKGRRWRSIVLDEAQAVKNMHTKRSQAVMALQGDFRMAATGTPLENHLGELWNLFRFINPGLLGSADQFQLRFAGPIEKAQDKRAEAGARSRLRRLTAPFILRRTKAQVLSELPPRTEIVVPVELSAEENALYESLRRQALDKLAALEAPEGQKAIEILAEMMRLRRACCNPELVAPGAGIASSKLATFARLTTDLLENRHKVLVFSQFVDHLTLIRQYLDAQGIAYQYLDGSTPIQERKRRVDAFQAGEGDLFLISLKAGGVGINLTAADYVIHMDPWWNPAVEDQASDRAHRMGQLRPVTIYRLVARGTIEEGIVDLHRHKRDLADSLLEGTEMAARMSPGDMLEMLKAGLGR
ncbi:DEAD/DEAH box helicase [Massilia sp. CFBP9012]|uniref:DEAD/DEAH box helicase n=1 Tax=Massilia sp. CFBP9012 TaxID=3096531 RepID=UPI002A6AF20A|nr:DEAD/DEAH box helicase [Massilia sp. CFBP9012]MDY0975958.1 DEAD/DEAH box helicase [Massilia sp. CFBP9012]